MAIIKATAGQQLVFVWKHQGQECPFISCTDPKLVKSYADYALIDNDLRSARECFEHIKKYNREDHIVQNSLLANAVVTYARSFTDGDARNAKLTAGHIFKNKPTCNGTHDWLMELRHKFFAHAGGTAYEAVMVCAALNPDKKSGLLECYRGLVSASSFPDQQSDEAIAVINVALDWVKIKIDAAYNHMKKLIAQEKAEDLYKIAIDPGIFGSDVQKIFIT